MFKLHLVRRGANSPYKTMEFKDRAAARKWLSDGGYFYGSVSTADWKDTGSESATFVNAALNEKVRIGDTELRGATTASLDFAKDRRGDYILAGDEVIADTGDGIDTYEVLKVLPGNKVKIGGVYGNGWYDIEVDGRVYGHSVSDAILVKNANFGFDVQVKDARGRIVFPMSFAYIKKELDHYGDMTPAYRIDDVYADGSVLLEKYGKVKGRDIVVKNTALNAAYSKALEYIMSSVKPYMDKRIKGDQSWKYPMLVITVLRKVCDKAVMSAGRYDNGRPRHRIYDINCEKDGWKFSGNLIITGLLHRDDPDDVSTFDEYDMTLSLMNVGKATNSTNPVVANAIAWRARNALVSRYNPGDTVLYERRSPAVHTSVDGFMPGFREKMKIRLVAKRSGGLWEAKDDGGNKIVVDEADFMGKA